ncbi:hypothetical protein CFN78_11295 [Amycolatopsis antarctica]|uniref:Serine protease n=1 Tax=Amycolatopsis antarctica TaxID=1854586 RepID=A0A263D4M7_9PSEU|nr:serine protease [Amycolatopsis antarctica]OZM73410.1 hypothetical protein CFN78_11295 [Amycolatopsis antarctica]
MTRRRSIAALLPAVAGLALCTTATPVLAAEDTASAQAAEVNFAGTVALDNCSGSVVRLASAAPEDPAVVLSNGHCLSEGFPGPGQVLVDQPSDRTFELLSADGASTVATLTATKLLYATMTGTDASLYQLDTSYAELEQQTGIAALELSDTKPAAGADINVVSGYWKEIYTCAMDGPVFELHEGGYVWQDSIRYTPECQTIGGTSGSPIVDGATGKVVGVNNTGNESGGECTMNNPCEVDENGEKTVRQGINYGQQTYLFHGCLVAGSEIDLARPECALPKPAAALPEAA